MGAPVAMKAATTRRPLLSACARTLRMKCTRQRCQVAVTIFDTAASLPFVRVGDHQLSAAQAAPGELAQEIGPEGFGLRGADRYAEHYRMPAGLRSEL